MQIREILGFRRLGRLSKKKVAKEKGGGGGSKLILDQREFQDGLAKDHERLHRRGPNTPVPFKIKCLSEGLDTSAKCS